MRPLPRWLRRLVIDPAVVLGVVVAMLSLPLVVPSAAFLSRYVPGKWRIARIVWFLFLYLVIEAVGLIAMFGLWVASGFGWKLGTPGFRAAHHTLFAWMLRRVVASAKVTFRMSIDLEGQTSRAGSAGQRRPIIVLSRHAGPGDSILLMDRLANRYKRRPRIVLKEFLKWDPALDVMLHRIPAAFVPWDKTAGRAVVEEIARLAATMGEEDVLVIFPEGANYTPKRARRAVEKLHEIGRPDLAERALQLRNTLPPKSTGVLTAIAQAQSPTDVFVVGHAGLETFVAPGDIWRGMPLDTRIAVRVWHIPAEQLPPAGEQETWLYDLWAEVDTWISERLTTTGEPFDDPDFY
jgi:1-acyl-sn-glycerol-3-phosphate acyltransferase